MPRPTSRTRPPAGGSRPKRPFPPMRPFLALLALPILSAAAELSLDDSLRLALERHPDVLAADAGSRLRLAEALAAEQRAAPRLEAEAKDLGGEGGAEIRVVQPLRRGDLGLRSRYAAAERAAAKAEAKARLLGALNDTFQAHVALWAAQSAAATALAREAEAAGLAARARAAAADGLVAPAALAGLEADAQDARAARAATEASRLEAAAALARRLGASALPVAAAPSLAPLPADAGGLVDFALRRSEVRAAVAERETAARRRREVDRAEADNPVEVGVLAEQRADGESWGVGIGFSMDLPVPGRRRAAAAVADAELRAVRAHPLLAQPDAVAAEVRARLEAARAAAAAADAQGLALAARERAAEDSARALDEGLATIPEHADVLARLDDARRRQLELRLDSLRARSRLEEALGGRLEQALP